MMESVYETAGGPPLILGVGALARLADHDIVAGRPAVIIADAAVAAAGIVARIERSVDAIATFVTPPAEPTSDSVDAAADVVRGAPNDVVVIGVGGGSALDTAKQAAAVGADVHSVEHYTLSAHSMPPRRSLIAVPTTSGTGAEVTRTCVLTDRLGRKVWTWDQRLVPDLVVLDPSTTVSVPAPVTASTGLDAFVHAVEAATGLRTTDSVRAAARQAIDLIVRHLPTAVARGDDLDARQAMQEAAYFAGVAIDGGGTGVAHAIGHALGVLAHVPHGVAVGTAFVATLDWSIEGAPDRYANADVTAEVLSSLIDAASFSQALRGLPALSVDVDELAAATRAPENLPMWDNNARVGSPADAEHLAERTIATFRALQGSR
jgi:alcohol dehydrogenase class IV